MDSVSEYRAKYSELFEWLGELRDFPYIIKLRDDASPVALTVPRHVPYPLLPKVKTVMYGDIYRNHVELRNEDYIL